MAILDTVLIKTNSNQIIGIIVAQYDSNQNAGANDTDVITADIKFEGNGIQNCVLDTHANDVGVGPDNIALQKKLSFTFAGANRANPIVNGGSSTPGQAAHYIGTWDVAVAYAAGECVRAWDAGNNGWALFQAKVATTGDAPDVTASTAAWELYPQDGKPIVMWGSEDPNTTESGPPNGPGVCAPPGSLYLWKSTEIPSNATIVLAFMARSFDDFGFPGQIAGPIYNGIWSVARASVSDNDPAMSADVRSFAHIRFGTGDADARSTSLVDNGLTGTAYGGAIASNGAREAHVLPTANATEAFNDVMGDVIFTDNTEGPVIHDQTDGHTYRIICTAGVLGVVQIT